MLEPFLKQKGETQMMTVDLLFHREWDLHVKHLSWPNQKSPTGNNRKHLQLKAKYSNCYYWLVPPIDNDLYAHSTITHV